MQALIERPEIGDAATRSGQDEALSDLIRWLKARDYRFITATPVTHARVAARSTMKAACDLRGIFGWNLPFEADLLDRDLLDRLRDSDLVAEEDGKLKSRVRVSSLGSDLYVHSAYPTNDKDSVFFGPDSYRFATLIAHELARCPQRPGAKLVDIGTGAGVGAIVAAHCCPDVEVAMTDVNARALRFASVNARTAGVTATGHLGDGLSPVEGMLDIVLANPPYIIDEAGRAYRDGGGMHGAAVSLEMAQAATPRLASGGRFILYTGSAIVDGEDRLEASLRGLAKDEGCTLRYAEIDPDVFGEELETEAYREVERIALVSAVIERAEA